VTTAQANLEAAELNVGFTKVRSLIDGVAGLAQLQVGSLVGTSSVLTSVSQLDPIKVYFFISEQEYLSLSTRVRKGGRGDLGDVDRRRVQRRSHIPAVADCRSKRDRYPSRCFCIEPSRRSARWNATSSDRFRRSSCSCRTVHRHPRFPELDSRLGISYVAQWFLATRSLLQPGSETASSLGRARETSPCPRSVPDWFRS